MHYDIWWTIKLFVFILSDAVNSKIILKIFINFNFRPRMCNKVDVWSSSGFDLTHFHIFNYSP